MALAMDTVDWWGLVTKYVVTAKEEYGNAVFAIHYTVKAIYAAVHY